MIFLLTTDNGQRTTVNLSLSREQSQTCLNYAEAMVQMDA